MPLPLPPIHAETLEPLYQAPQPPIGPALGLIGVGLVLAIVLGAALHRRRTAERTAGDLPLPPPPSADLLAQVDTDQSLKLDLATSRKE